MAKHRAWLLTGLIAASAAVMACGTAAGSGTTDGGKVNSPAPVAGDVRLATPTPSVATLPDGSMQVSIYMQAPTGQYQTGTAEVRSVGEKTEVNVSVRPAQPQAQPIHIHSGDCSDKMGPVVSVLQDVVNGESRTTFDKPVREIFGAERAINVHMSASDIGVYTACGAVPAVP